MWCPKLGKTFPKEQESGVYTLIISKSQFKKKQTKNCTACTVCAVCTVCSLRFIMTKATAVECSSLTWSMGRQIWRDERNCFRDKSTQILLDMLGTPTWQRNTCFQLRQTLNKNIYGYLWEQGEFSLFKRKPLSLIFGVRNNKFEYLIKHLISVRIK